MLSVGFILRCGWKKKFLKIKEEEKDFYAIDGTKCLKL